jgi:phosphoglycerate dehydrogenase-like enzyme
MPTTTDAKILILLQPSLYTQLFTPQTDRALRELGEVTFWTYRHEPGQDPTSEQLAEQIPGFDVVVTAWGSPTFTTQVLDAAEHLTLVAHSGGTIKHMLPPAVFERGISVTHAASAIAPAVAEMTILLILLCLRRACMHDRMLKVGEPWESTRVIPMGEELADQRVGVVGAGYTGRRTIALLRALNAEVWVYDPYLSQEGANKLGVRQATLDELLTNCPVVTLQAPATEETYHMIGARELRLLQEGAILVNTARSHVVDQDALLAELHTGRFQAALDVFDQEPLPVDSPFRALDNVILTPHIAGASRQARVRQGRVVVEEIERFLAGKPLRHRVTREMLDIMA